MELTVKKFVLIAVGAAAGWIVWSRVQQERAERELWAEVTDSFGETPESYRS